MLDYLQFLLELDSFSFNEVVAAVANYQAQKEPRKRVQQRHRTRQRLAHGGLGLKQTEIDNESWPPKCWSPWKPYLHLNSI